MAYEFYSHDEIMSHEDARYYEKAMKHVSIEGFIYAREKDAATKKSKKRARIVSHSLVGQVIVGKKPKNAKWNTLVDFVNTWPPPRIVVDRNGNRHYEI